MKQGVKQTNMDKKILKKVKSKWVTASIALAFLGLNVLASGNTVHASELDNTLQLAYYSDKASTFANKGSFMMDPTVQAESRKAIESITDNYWVNTPMDVAVEIERQQALGLPVYVVQQGDNLFAIAQATQSSPEELAHWNGIQDPNQLVVGDILLLQPSQGSLAVSLNPIENNSLGQTTASSFNNLDSQPLVVTVVPNEISVTSHGPIEPSVVQETIQSSSNNTSVENTVVIPVVTDQPVESTQTTVAPTTTVEPTTTTTTVENKETTVKEPDATTTAPVETTTNPVVTTTQPVTTTEPVVTTTQPVTTTEKPVVTTEETTTTTEKPIVTTTEPTKPTEPTTTTVETTTEPTTTTVESVHRIKSNADALKYFNPSALNNAFLKLVNQHRKELGYKPVAFSPVLYNDIMLKRMQQIQDNGSTYFYSPNGTSYSHVTRDLSNTEVNQDANIHLLANQSPYLENSGNENTAEMSMNYAGLNLTNQNMNEFLANEYYRLWFNSPLHYDNLFKKDLTHLVIGATLSDYTRTGYDSKSTSDLSAGIALSTEDWNFERGYNESIEILNGIKMHVLRDKVDNTILAYYPVDPTVTDYVYGLKKLPNQTLVNARAAATETPTTLAETTTVETTVAEQTTTVEEVLTSEETTVYENPVTLETTTVETTVDEPTIIEPTTIQEEVITEDLPEEISVESQPLNVNDIMVNKLDSMIEI